MLDETLADDSRDFYWDPTWRGPTWRAQRDRCRTLLPLSVRAAAHDLLCDFNLRIFSALQNPYIFGGGSVPRCRGDTGRLCNRLVRPGAAFDNRADLPRRGWSNPADFYGRRSTTCVNVPPTSSSSPSPPPSPPSSPFLAAFENLADRDIVLTSTLSSAI